MDALFMDKADLSTACLKPSITASLSCDRQIFHCRSSQVRDEAASQQQLVGSEWSEHLTVRNRTCNPLKQSRHCTGVSLVAEGEELEDWRGSMAILAASPAPYREAGLLRLGNRLQNSAGQACHLHLSFLKDAGHCHSTPGFEAQGPGRDAKMSQDQ